MPKAIFFPWEQSLSIKLSQKKQPAALTTQTGRCLLRSHITKHENNFRWSSTELEMSGEVIFGGVGSSSSSSGISPWAREKGRCISPIMGVNIPGVIVMVIFYLLVLGTGIWASFKSKRKQKKSAATEMEMALLGNRSINCVVGIFTMTGKDSELPNIHIILGFIRKASIYSME